MNHDDIEKILTSEPRITPSLAFLASVMSAVEREPESLPPLDFPWLRALPGFLATIVAVVAAIWHGVGILSDPAAIAAIKQTLTQFAVGSSLVGLQWIVLALLITSVALGLSWGFARGGHYA